MSGWIGVDLDGTLAEYGGWSGGQIGKPVPAMVARVKQWLEAGQDVRIFTARVAVCGAYSMESKRYADDGFAQEQIALINAWCLEHIGRVLPVTATKDFQCVEIYDDRAKQVKMNTGWVIGEKTPENNWWDDEVSPEWVARQKTFHGLDKASGPDRAQVGKEMVTGEKYLANFLFGHSEDSVEAVGYEFANAQTEEYRKLMWDTLLERLACKYSPMAPEIDTATLNWIESDLQAHQGFGLFWMVAQEIQKGKPLRQAVSEMIREGKRLAGEL